MDGCADVGGCLEAPFAIFELCSRGKPGGFVALLAIVAGIGLAVGTNKPAPQPKPPITDRMKDAIGHPINRWKIERAEKRYHKEQLERWKAMVDAADTAPIDTNEPRVRDRIKDWMRDKLNEDYDKRNPKENK